MGFLKIYDKAPRSKKFPMVRRWIDETPLPLFEELRAERPIFKTSVCTFVTRFDDVVEVLRIPSVFTVALYAPKMGEFMLSQDETPLHFREKAIMQSMLNRDDLPRIRNLVAEKSKEALNQANGKIELIQEYARLIPTLLVQEYFGLDGVEPQKMMKWSYWNQYNTFHNQPFDLVDDRENIVKNHQETGLEMINYMKALIPRRMGEIKSGKKRDDVLSRMLRTVYPEEVGFPIDRLARNAGGLLIGSVETTAQAVSQILQELFSRRSVLKKAIASAESDDLDSFDAIVWEALRFKPIAPYLFRKAASHYTLAKGTEREAHIRKNTLVLPMIYSATFDETAFPDPYKFKAKRPWYNTFHFGFGHHECLGKYVGMVMIPEMVRQVLLRPNLKANKEIDYQGGPFPESYAVSWGEKAETSKKQTPSHRTRHRKK